MLAPCFALVLVAGCAPAATPITVTTPDQVVAAKGKHVHVEGRAQREKLGDAIEIGALTILCVGGTFGNAAVGAPVAADGTLNVTDRYRAHVGPSGEQSAGTTDSTWVLDGCTPTK